MNRFTLIILLSLLISTKSGFSQTTTTKNSCLYTLSGKVTDSETGESLPFAHIHIEEIDAVSMTDTLGRYIIGGLCANSYTLRCTHLGCTPLVQKVSLNRDTVLNFKMPHSIYNLSEVQIVHSRYVPASVQSKNELSGQDIMLGRGENLGTMLEKIPGVTALQTGSTVVKPVINGLHSQRIVLINNGVRQEGQQWGMEHAPEIDPFIADKIIVVKGANSVRYGTDAIGGIIITEAKPLRYVQGLGGEVNTAFFTNGRGGSISARLDGNFNFLPAFAWRVQGTLKKMGDLKTPDYFLKNTGNEEYNYAFATGYKRGKYEAEVFYSQYNAKLGVFTGSHIGNLTDLEAAIHAEKPLVATASFSYDIGRPYQYAEHELTRLTNKWKAGKAGLFSLNLARQFNRRSEYDAHKPFNDSLAALNNPQLKLYVRTYTGDLVREANVNGWRSAAGLNIMWQNNDYKGRFLIPEYQTFTGGVWATIRKRFKRIEAEAGLRYDNRKLTVYGISPTNDTTVARRWQQVSSSGGLIYRPDSVWQISAYAGTAWRAPHVSELYSYGVHHGAASFEIGNSALTRERALNNAVALAFTKKVLTFKVDVYYNIIKDFIYMQPTLPPTLTIRGAFPTFEYKQTDAVFAGIDWVGQILFANGLSIENKGSYLNARDTRNNTVLPLTPPMRMETMLKYKWKDTKVITDNFAGIALQNVWKKTGIADSSDYLPPPNAYFLLRAEAGGSLKVAKGQVLKIALTAQNLLNARYRNYMNRFRYFSDETGLNIALKMAYSF